jgi:microcystin-dependent protein
MSEPFIGEIMLVGFSYAPRYWAMCQGQTLAVAQNQALFSLLGTTYGGDGVNTFQLPDLRARVATHFGQYQGTNVVIGQTGGVPNVTLAPNQIPPHSHTITVDDTPATTTSCMNAWLAGMAGAYITEPADRKILSKLNPNMLAQTGGGTPHDNRQPLLGMNYIIALQGIYPSRN